MQVTSFVIVQVLGRIVGESLAATYIYQIKVSKMPIIHISDFIQKSHIFDGEAR